MPKSTAEKHRQLSPKAAKIEPGVSLSEAEESGQKVKRSKAAELFAETARRLEDGAYDEQNALIATAESEGLMLKRAEGISESQPGEGVLGHASVVNALFSDDVLSGNNSGGIVLGE